MSLAQRLKGIGKKLAPARKSTYKRDSSKDAPARPIMRKNPSSKMKQYGDKGYKPSSGKGVGY